MLENFSESQIDQENFPDNFYRTKLSLSNHSGYLSVKTIFVKFNGQIYDNFYLLPRKTVTSVKMNFQNWFTQ